MANQPHSRRSCILGVFIGAYRICEQGTYKRKSVVIKIRCGRWDCPICADKKAKKVYKRAMNGRIHERAQKAGFRDFNFKLLTLTYGGKAKRASSSPEQAAREMSEACAKLIKELRHLYGYFDFLKVFETHKDGWPHLHILICGEAIAPKVIKQDIDRLWIERYGMGFTKINFAPNPQKALNYILKYLFKCPVQLSGIRMFSNSEGGLAPVQPKELRDWEGFEVMWAEKHSTYLRFENLMQHLGDEEAKIDIEVLPVKGCPF